MTSTLTPVAPYERDEAQRSPTPFLVVAARLLMAQMFIISGFGKLLNVQGAAAAIASLGVPLASVLASAVAVFEVATGAAMVVGWHSRTAAVALAAFTGAASVMFHAFWSAPPEARSLQEILFMKNIAVVGGVILVAALRSDARGIARKR